MTKNHQALNTIQSLVFVANLFLAKPNTKWPVNDMILNF